MEDAAGGQVEGDAGRGQGLGEERHGKNSLVCQEEVFKNDTNKAL